MDAAGIPPDGEGDDAADESGAGDRIRKGRETMGGLRFDSMADMPAGMRDLYAKKILGGMPKEMPTPEKKAAKYQNQKAERGRIHFDI